MNEDDIFLIKIFLPQHHESEGEIIHQHIKSLVLFTEKFPDPPVIGLKLGSILGFGILFFLTIHEGNIF